MAQAVIKMMLILLQQEQAEHIWHLALKQHLATLEITGEHGIFSSDVEHGEGLARLGSLTVITRQHLVWTR